MASLQRVARYFVGLGTAAVAETLPLAEAVLGLGLGALYGVVARGNVRSVGSIESSGWGVGVG